MRSFTICKAKSRGFSLAFFMLGICKYFDKICCASLGIHPWQIGVRLDNLVANSNGYRIDIIAWLFLSFRGIESGKMGLHNPPKNSHKVS